ncbi:MAG TPA: diacylglycerol kinase family protein [Candidatus Limnocylindrales bacterium]|nr:diacylglycerol kinase family protein [Candidatus Limnocylindrales bacterium]
MPTATLIVSPLASRIRDADTRARIVESAQASIVRRGIADIRVVVSGDHAEIRAAAAESVGRGDALVVVAGGDGTVRDATGPLAGTSLDVAILPCGTGNLYATAVGVPRSMPKALEAVATGSPTPVDHASVRLVAPPGMPADRLPAKALAFGVACGTGFDAELIAATDRELKRRYGVAAYFLTAGRLLPRLAPRPARIVVDGEATELDAVVVLVANCGDAIPGTLRPRLPLDARDGLLHVFVLPRGGVVGGIRGMLELMISESQGVSPSGHSARLTGREVRVEMTPAAPTQVDGDPFPAAWLEAHVLPGALRVIG